MSERRVAMEKMKAWIPLVRKRFGKRGSKVRLGDVVRMNYSYGSFEGFIFCKDPLYLFPYNGAVTGCLVSERNPDTVEVFSLPLWFRAIVYISSLRMMLGGKWMG